MINLRDEILKALPIPNFFTWYKDNWGRSNLEIWADEVVELEKEGIVKIKMGRVELVAQRTD